jgi:hypothetical protein
MTARHTTATGGRQLSPAVPTDPGRHEFWVLLTSFHPDDARRRSLERMAGKEAQDGRNE